MADPHPKCMISRDSHWDLVSQTDRAQPYGPVAHGEGLEAGIRALWKHMLKDGVDDDGRATAARFALALDGKDSARFVVEVRASAGAHGGLARLREWMKQPTTALPVLDAIGTAHAGLLYASERWGQEQLSVGAESEPIRMFAEVIDDPGVLCRALRPKKH
jgi:hypothetical protein